MGVPDTKTTQKQGSYGQHGAHLGPVVPRWAPCWRHEPCYQGSNDKTWINVLKSEQINTQLKTIPFL